MADAIALNKPLAEAPWVNITDPSSPALDEIASTEGFHHLDIEDCRHRNQIAKVMDHETYTFIVIKTIRFEKATLELEFDDFDLFVKQNSVLTIEEHNGSTIIGRATQRLQKDHAQKPWHIVHSLIDVAVDDYLPVLDVIGEAIDELETDVLEEPTPQTLHRVLGLKRTLIEFRRNATAMREVVNHLLRNAPRDRFLYLRDVYDHLVRIIDFIETYRDLVTGSLDIYLSSIANRTNDVVKVLTIYGTVALPLLVITGFFGMNFPNLPLLATGSGLVIAVTSMVVSSLAILLYFWRKGWI